jgi:hypothetical protein
MSEAIEWSPGDSHPAIAKHQVDLRHVDASTMSEAIEWSPGDLLTLLILSWDSITVLFLGEELPDYESEDDPFSVFIRLTVSDCIDELARSNHGQCAYPEAGRKIMS